MASICVFTIASKNYLAYVRTMFSSVAKLHPEYRLFLCLADRVDGYFDAEAEPYEVIQADQLGIQNFEDMALRYDIMELNTAVKPSMFRWLFENTDFDTVIYLDPDTCAYSKFDRLESAFASGASVVLTPHITRPLEDGKSPNDQHMLQAGVFNLGFIAAHRCGEALDFLAWWERRLSSQCLSDLKSGLFVDQKWCDLAPCFLDELKIFKDPGYNVAYWNLAQREVVETPEREWIVNGSPLVFFHFSGVDFEKKNMVSKHQNRFGWDDIRGCQRLFDHYLEQLAVNGWSETCKWPYAYRTAFGNFQIGTLIRRLYRSTFPHPMDIGEIDIEEYLVELCNQTADGFSGEDTVRITRLMILAYDLRPDVQSAFSLNTSDGRLQFTSWFEVAGEREYGLPSSVTRPDRSQTLSRSNEGSKKTAVWCYRTLNAAEKPLGSISESFRATDREKYKALWFKIKAHALRAL